MTYRALRVNQWITILRIGGTAIPFSDRRRIAEAITLKPGSKVVSVKIQPETVAIIEGR